MIGGFFLQLSYFGTDQSQVGRYLSGESVGESRLGLLMNGILKIPMQFLILLVGVLVFVFYQFHEAPLFFNKTELQKVEQTVEYQEITKKNQLLFAQKKEAVEGLSIALKSQDETLINTQKIKVEEVDKQSNILRNEVKDLIKKADKNADVNDTNYIFLSFVTKYLPQGLVGLFDCRYSLSFNGFNGICF